MIIEGQQLSNGRYRLLNLISRSSTSEIYLAQDTQLSHQVAIKAVPPENSAYPNVDVTKWGSRFLLPEIEIILKFNHPHILPLLGYGEEFVNGNMLTYLVMPFCPEGSLAAWLKRRNNILSPQDIVQLVRQATAALTYAHYKQIIHLNVKPSNFLIGHQSNKGNTSLPDLLLTNFRIIKIDAESLNGIQTPYGTPHFMAPEQWNGHPVPATDQYALAITAYQLLTSHYPFQGTPEQLKHQHLNEQPQRPSTFNQNLTKDIDEVILHALAKKPEDRFKSISAFARAFEQAILVSNLPNTVDMPVKQKGEDIHTSIGINQTDPVAPAPTSATPSATRYQEPSASPPTPIIFISYARVDADIGLVDRLEGDLRKQGFTPWVDRHNLGLGVQWRIELQDAIDRSQVLLVVLSPDSIVSPNVRAEYGYALDQGKVVIPLFYRQCNVPMELRAIQGVDFQHSYKVGWSDLLHALHPQLSSLSPPISSQDQAYMLHRLRYSYHEMMKQSLQGAARLELGLAHRPNAVENPTRLLLRQPNQPELPLAPGTSILHVYEEAQHELLILGEPGTGKSTLLLQLAQHLIEQAEKDVTRPLPVILPLSSWATKRPPMQDWLSDQFSLIYDVPHKVSQQWVRQERLLPLLDGLDEMEASARAACITALNAYHQEHLQPLVVCSRAAEYDNAAVSERLVLHSAVVVQPLSRAQVDANLVAVGKPLAGLRSAMQNNPVLQELATTPLMLSVLMLTYQGKSVSDVPKRGSRQEQQQQVFASYIEGMVEYKGDKRRYPLLSTSKWLCWLARQMRNHNQTVFSLEGLQPDWLPERQRALYRWSVRLAGGLVVALLFGLVGGLVIGPVGGLVGGLVVGLIGVLIGGLVWRNWADVRIEPAEVLTWVWKGAISGLVRGLVIGAVVGLVVDLDRWLVGLLIFALVVGVVGAIFGLAGGLNGLIGGLVRGNWSDVKRLFAKILTWAWKGVGFVLVGGLVLGLVLWLDPSLLPKASSNRIAVPFLGLAGGLVGALIGGFSGKQLTERLSLFPNKGIRRSVKHGLLWGGVGMLVSGLGVGLSIGLGRGLVGGLIGGLIGGSVGGLVGGLAAAARHYILRFWLWQTHTFPWKAQSFLDDATTRMLLWRVGGGYSFAHRLLLDHFADRDPGSASLPQHHTQRTRLGIS